jgi:ABC-type lipoprotein release transport system permease subunit
MRWTPFVAGRYVLSKNNPNAINLITGIAMGGFVIGAMALILVLSVFNGFENVVSSLYNSFNPSIKITPKYDKFFELDSATLNKVYQITDKRLVSFTLEENVALRYNDKQGIATIKGVDDNYWNINGLDTLIFEGSRIPATKDGNFAVLGFGVAVRLGISTYNEFTRLAIYLPKKDARLDFNPEAMLNSAFVYPSGIFSVEDNINNKYVIIPLNLAQELIERKNCYSAIEIKTYNEKQIDRIKKELEALLGENFSIKTRRQQEDGLYKIFNYEKWITTLILVSILFLLSITASSSLTLLVLNKKSDLSILKSMGATNQNISRIIMIQGLIIASVGSFFGLALGLVLAWLQMTFGFIGLGGGETFIIHAYPVQIKIQDVFLVVLVSLVLGFTTALIPSRKAARTKLFFR